MCGAAVHGGKAVGLRAGVGGDEEVRDEVSARSAFAQVAQEHLAGQVSALRRESIVNKTEGDELGQGLLGVGKTW